MGTHKFHGLGPPVVPFLTNFSGRGSPTKIDYGRKIGYPYFNLSTGGPSGSPLGFSSTKNEIQVASERIGTCCSCCCRNWAWRLLRLLWAGDEAVTPLSWIQVQPWLLLGNTLHLCVVWFSGKFHLTANMCCFAPLPTSTKKLKLPVNCDS